MGLKRISSLGSFPSNPSVHSFSSDGTVEDKDNFVEDDSKDMEKNIEQEENDDGNDIFLNTNMNGNKGTKDFCCQDIHRKISNDEEVDYEKPNINFKRNEAFKNESRDKYNIPNV